MCNHFKNLQYYRKNRIVYVRLFLETLNEDTTEQLLWHDTNTSCKCHTIWYRLVYSGTKEHYGCRLTESIDYIHSRYSFVWKHYIPSRYSFVWKLQLDFTNHVFYVASKRTWSISFITKHSETTFFFLKIITRGDVNVVKIMNYCKNPCIIRRHYVLVKEMFLFI